MGAGRPWGGPSWPRCHRRPCHVLLLLLVVPGQVAVASPSQQPPETRLPTEQKPRSQQLELTSRAAHVPSVLAAPKERVPRKTRGKGKARGQSRLLATLTWEVRFPPRGVSARPWLSGGSTSPWLAGRHRTELTPPRSRASSAIQPAGAVTIRNQIQTDDATLGSRFRPVVSRRPPQKCFQEPRPLSRARITPGKCRRQRDAGPGDCGSRAPLARHPPGGKVGGSRARGWGVECWAPRTPTANVSSFERAARAEASPCSPKAGRPAFLRVTGQEGEHTAGPVPSPRGPPSRPGRLPGRLANARGCRTPCPQLAPVCALGCTWGQRHDPVAWRTPAAHG